MTEKKKPTKKKTAKKKPEDKKQDRIFWSEDIGGFWLVMITKKSRIPICVLNLKNQDLITELKTFVPKEV